MDVMEECVGVRGPGGGQIEQFVKEIELYSSQYGNSSSISYTVVNLIGKPRVYPRYGDSHEAYSPRTYGLWWDSFSWKHSIQTRNKVRIQAKDFVVVSFEIAVFPSQVSIYETLNPGSVVRIWASPCFSSSHTEPAGWKLLYEGESQITEKCSRIFSPPLRNIPFPTRRLRLDLDHRHLDYYCQLDAVKLSGFQPGQIGVLETLRLTDFDRVKPGNAGPVVPEQPADTNQLASLVSLPQELVHCVLGHLDLRSLCRVACTCRRLKTLAYDWSLYTDLDLIDQWHRAMPALLALQSRCQRITTLRLRGSFQLSVTQFLSVRGLTLTNLSLDSCTFAGTDALALGDCCPNLSELTLRGLQGLPVPGSLRGLCRLRRLDLYRSAITQAALLATLEENPRLEHLNVGSCENIEKMDVVARVLSENNVGLKSLDAWKSRGWTTAGLSSLSRLAGLQELDLGWSLGDQVDWLLPLVTSCQSLRKLGLAACRGTSDTDILQLAQCASALQQLDLTGVKGLSDHALERALCGLPGLRLLDLSFCGVATSQLSRWQHLFPSVRINAVAGP